MSCGFNRNGKEGISSVQDYQEFLNLVVPATNSLG